MTSFLSEASPGCHDMKGGAWWGMASLGQAFRSGIVWWDRLRTTVPPGRLQRMNDLVKSSPETATTFFSIFDPAMSSFSFRS